MKPKRPSIDQIVADEIQSEYNEIMDYRYAVASGIENYEHEVLDDNELTDAMKRVIEYYLKKGKQKYYDSDDAYTGNIQDGFDFGRD